MIIGVAASRTIVLDGMEPAQRHSADRTVGDGRGVRPYRNGSVVHHREGQVDITMASSSGQLRSVTPFRVVLTGGPGGGKTTAADLFRREIGDRVIVVPEAATLLFSGGFPRPTQSDAQRSAQCAIYQVQRGLEDIQASQYPERILLCDRGTVDGGAYWPDGAAGSSPGSPCRPWPTGRPCCWSRRAGPARPRGWRPGRACPPTRAGGPRDR